jgi:hypothetical protein
MSSHRNISGPVYHRGFGGSIISRQWSRYQRGFCFTVNVFPANSIVPTRASLLLLADTEYATTPSPLATAADVIVTQLTLLAAVQPHPLAAATLTVPVPPLLPNDLVFGEIEKIQLLMPS